MNSSPATPAAAGSVVTPIAALEEKVRRQEAQLAELQRELESFSYSVSHDLRAPLRGIIGFARMLGEAQGGTLSDEGRRFLQVIQSEANRASRYIEDLTALSRVGRQRLSGDNVDMADLARSAFDDLLESGVQGASSVLAVQSLPVAWGDRALLRIVFAQLLGNALKFSAGRPEMRIVVSGETREGWSEYCVADTGAGFDQRYVDRLFGVFQRLHRADEFEGSGIGLAIVQRIIQRHGGRVRAEGQVGVGARFYFALPACGLCS